MPHLLEVKNLQTHFQTRAGLVRAVDGVSFQLDRGELLGLVGESGCGKSVTALSLMRLVAPPGRIVGGEVLFDGVDLLQLPEARMREIRGDDIAMIFQDPMTSLNPVYTVGEQIAEALRLHRGLNRKQAREAAVAAMREVSIPDPALRAVPKLTEAEVKKVERLQTIEGTVPKPTNLPEGCHFAPRCPHRMPRCTEGDLPLYRLEGGVSVRCVLYDLTAAVAADREITRMREGGAV